MKGISSHIFLFVKDYRPMMSGWQGAPYSRRYGRRLVSKQAISLKKSWGGYRRTTHFCEKKQILTAAVGIELKDQRH